jgi:hypothetical protein
MCLLAPSALWPPGRSGDCLAAHQPSAGELRTLHGRVPSRRARLPAAGAGPAVAPAALTPAATQTSAGTPARDGGRKERPPRAHNARGGPHPHPLLPTRALRPKAKSSCRPPVPRGGCGGAQRPRGATPGSRRPWPPVSGQAAPATRQPSEHETRQPDRNGQTVSRTPLTANVGSPVTHEATYQMTGQPVWRHFRPPRS